MKPITHSTARRSKTPLSATFPFYCMPVPRGYTQYIGSINIKIKYNKGVYRAKLVPSTGLVGWGYGGARSLVSGGR